MSTLSHGQLNLGCGYFFLMDENLAIYDHINQIRDGVMKEFDGLEQCKILKPINIIDLYKIIVKGKLHSINLQDMSIIIQLLYEKNSKLLADKIYSYSDMSHHIDKIKNEINQFNNCRKDIFNVVSRFIFVVSDLDSLTKNIKNLGLINVNTGPQSFRGTTSYINYLLITLGKDFRDSMSRHNLSYINKYSNPIHISKFNYNNIHNNLGKSRWYSTGGGSTNSVSDKLDNKMVDRNIFDNYLFSYISSILKTNPINEETQKSIELFFI